MIFYIGDIHLNDQIIFNKCSRSFKNLEEYKDEIIKRWNSKVSEYDEVYVLGDIAEENDESTIEIFKQLKGGKHFIIGNHDTKLLDKIRDSKIFETINFIKVVNDRGRNVCVCHYPLMDWIEFNRGGYMFADISIIKHQKMIKHIKK